MQGRIEGKGCDGFQLPQTKRLISKQFFNTDYEDLFINKEVFVSKAHLAKQGTKTRLFQEVVNNSKKYETWTRDVRWKSMLDCYILLQK